MREERREKERREHERYLLIRWYCGRLPCKINTNSGRLTIRRTNFKHRPPCNPKKCPFLLLFLSFFTFLIFICWYLIELAAPRRFSALLSLQSDFSPLNDASVNWHPARTARYWGRFSFFFFWQHSLFSYQKLFKSRKVVLSSPNPTCHFARPNKTRRGSSLVYFGLARRRVRHSSRHKDITGVSPA